MAQEKLLSVSEIAQELDTGIASTKFLLKRFKKWLPCNIQNGQNLYSTNTIQTLFKIKKKLDLGILPSDIEKKLETVSLPESNTEIMGQSIANDLKLSHESLEMIKSLFSDFGSQQQRIAAAHQKRAEAEERKAVAIEKRAQAEEKKAEAMNNIASALQEMNRLRSLDPASQQIAHKAASVIVSDEIEEDEFNDDLLNIDEFSEFNETDEPGDIESPVVDDLDNMSDQDFSMDEIEDALEDTDVETDDPLASLLDDEISDDDILDSDMEAELDDISQIDDIEDIEDINDVDDMDLDNLSLLVDEKEDSKGNVSVDDLSSLLEESLDINHELDDLSSLIEDAIPTSDAPAPEVDDLSLLIDEPSSVPGEPDQGLDNLSLLVDEPALDPLVEQPFEKDPDLDDLNKLIDDNGKEIDAATMEGMDNLSLLIDDTSQVISDEIILDDLSQLIDEPSASGQEIDDLSLLVQDTGASSDEKNIPDQKMDDLSALVKGDPKTLDQNKANTDKASDIKKETDDLTALVKKDEAPKIKIDITPDENLAQYKSEVMKIILKLKSDGLGASETTKLFNASKIQTLSGKTEWGEKAISQIYKFIDSAK